MGGALLVLVAALMLTAVAYGAVREVGATADFTSVPCKDKNCLIVTRVTAFQLRVGSGKNVSRVPRDGSLVAYTLNLPSVTKGLITNFNSNYSGEPTARISVLRYAKRKGVTKYRYKLIAQSTPVKLRRYLGSIPSFSLAQPIAVKRNDIIAITTDSWLPAFSVLARDADNTWRASRPTGKCGMKGKNDFSNFQAGRMHETVGQVKQYNCGYKGARILYHATIVDSPPKTKGYK
jgi:hypothetical protein